MNKILIIGGGPAGMMAAIRAAELKQDVTIVEKNNSLGRKLLLTGNGRCNLTNACDLNSFLESCSNNDFLRGAFKHFFNRELMAFFESRGLKLKMEENNRVFPVTDRAQSVLEILQKETAKYKINVLYGLNIKELLVKNEKVSDVFLSDGKTLLADKIILATGGASYPSTGSNGEGIRIVGRLGHEIIPLRAGLASMEIKEAYPKALEGLTLQKIRLRFHSDKNEIYSPVGDILFTKNGISGPLVLSLSGKVGGWFGGSQKVFIDIDLKPESDQAKIDSEFLALLQANPKKQIKNVLQLLMPDRFAAVLIDAAKIPGNKLASQISRKERTELVSLIKGFRMEILKTAPIDKAMITCGGVSTREINPLTMESKIVRGLYFAGEMIDVDGDSGGFNLQIAFSTGYLAGQSAASE
ncbi:MAG: hypothetical protein A3G33_09340 [Omnitrophica bacterium RIFCSPLOWO2_12_FULL_44_17]|uniref:FAD-dependent oxidoreductase n=1 Tax=Candidatus Danuiimicrobium aquiferis TaxID=1801832 RepID=A0A1G1KWU5_9BACT|nr:MAG: hypothetical protein A3B72_10020 [Omnitrophica bacterium RIFCSPHIGHO2_02_FULL_45_28]OGW92069.1 MAG: hypothetical protein A3E74_00060 [Omnitrophica bacterium RIFCSPHIGHO2_12_FULL_44_12]OGW97388.1 MAG: hypothetical protein A3G33_09340 [Omnitrophica bacterium RIFCSPLOWO2_12_FULL_44_17]OGX04461.1 MAG: hypothetical protein A3J12_10375 [Omnitrophica bacterium RIFCSPLOWO2_02_FULL_44_11]